MIGRLTFAAAGFAAGVVVGLVVADRDEPDDPGENVVSYHAFPLWLSDREGEA